MCADVDHGLLERFCPVCHYSLRGIQSERCPECGEPVADILAGKSRIPWVQRREIGAYRAFWLTVWMVTVPRINRLFNDAGGAAPFADAQRFRWLVVAHAGAGVAIALGIAAQFAPGFDWTVAIPTALACGVFLALLTGLQTYFFHPRWLPIPLQNHMLAISYYLCGGFAWLPLAVGLLAAALYLPRKLGDVALAAQVTAALLPLVVFLSWYFAAVRAAWKLSRRVMRTCAVALLLPILSLILFLAVAGIPVAIVYVRLLFASLRD